MQGPDSALLVSAGTISLTVLLGNFLASFLVRGSARVSLFLAASLCRDGAGRLAAFTGTESASATAAVIVFAVAGGLTASTLFAAFPAIVPRGDRRLSPSPRPARPAAIGTVLGPPLAAAVIDAYGWAGFAWFLGRFRRRASSASCRCCLTGRRGRQPM